MTPDVHEKSASMARPAHPLRRTVANIGWNWVGTAVAMACGFFVAPFLIRHLGDTGYGLWIVMGSLVGYFSLLDFGVRGAVGRYIAFYRAKGDMRGVAETFNSALVIMIAVAAASIVLTSTLSLVWLRLIHVPPEDLASARTAFFIVGANFAVTFPFQVFEGTLWGHQRFDILNWVDIPAVLVRTALSVYVVTIGFGIVALAIVTACVALAAGTAKAVFSFRESEAVRVRTRHVNRSAMRMLFGYGRWTSVISGARLTKAQLSPFVIGTLLNVAVVTPYAIARRLQDYASTMLWTATGVLTPVATDFCANNDRVRQRQLFLEGGAWCLAVAVYFLSMFAFLAKPFITLWVGERLAYAWVFLLVLALGDLIPMSQSVSTNMLLALAKHRPLALAAVSEVCIGLTLVTVLAPQFGLLGVCIGFAISQALCSGAATLYFAHRQLDVPFGVYTRSVVVPVCATAVWPVGALALVHRILPPQSWPQLMLVCAAFSAFYWSLWIVRTQRHRVGVLLGASPLRRGSALDIRLRSVFDGLRG